MKQFHILKFSLLDCVRFYFKSKKTQQMNIHQDIFNKNIHPVEIFLEWKNRFPLLFDYQFESYLLQSSLFKNTKNLSIYLMKNINFTIDEYPSYPVIKPLADGLLTDGLYRKNMIVWCALFSIHSTHNLLKFDSNYDYYEFEEVSDLFFSLPEIKKTFQNKTNRNLLLQHSCQEVIPYLQHLFMKIDLELFRSSDTLHIDKVNKI